MYYWRCEVSTTDRIPLIDSARKQVMRQFKEHGLVGYVDNTGLEKNTRKSLHRKRSSLLLLQIPAMNRSTCSPVGKKSFSLDTEQLQNQTIYQRRLNATSKVPQVYHNQASGWEDTGFSVEKKERRKKRRFSSIRASRRGWKV